jgi:hypothetical protein
MVTGMPASVEHAPRVSTSGGEALDAFYRPVFVELLDFPVGAARE